MPSLWSWLSGRKHRITSSKHVGYIEHAEDSPRERKHLHFVLKNKEVSKSKFVLSDGQTPLLNNHSEFRHLPPDSKELKRTQDNDQKIDARKVDDSAQGAAKRRLLAYEIFENTHSPLQNISNKKTNYQPSSDIKHYSQYNQEKNEFSAHKESENIDIFGVEMRQHRNNIFGGLASRLQRHSLQAMYPGHGRDVWRGPEYRRSETMAGYIPRAVGLHDVSTILSGGIKEGTSPSQHINPKGDRFHNRHEWSPRSYEMIPNVRPNSSHQRQQLPSSRAPSQHGNLNIGKNIRQSKVEDHKVNKVSRESLNKSRQKVSNGNSSAPSSSNGNFYFSSSMLSSVVSRSQTADPPPLEDAHKTELGGLFEEAKTKPNVHSTKNMHEQVINSTKSTINEYSDNNNSSVFTKVHHSSSQEFSTSSNTPNRNIINTNNIKDESDEIVKSVPELVEERVDDSIYVIHDKHLEGIFNTEGEVLY